MGQLFYQNGNFITLQKAGCHHSIFRTANHIIARISTDGVQKCKLLATDANDSIIYAHDSVENEERAYTAFGHSENLSPTRALQGFNGELIDEILGVYQLGRSIEHIPQPRCAFGRLIV